MKRPFLKFYYLQKTRKQQWLKKEKFFGLQWMRLKDTLRRAQRNIPFYGERFRRNGFDAEAIKGFNDLQRIPVLTKDEVKEAFNRQNIYNHNYLKQCIARTTSGSSGQPLTVYYDQESYAYSESIYARAFFEQGVKLNDRIAYFWYEPFKERGFWEYLGIFKKREILYVKDEEYQMRRLIELKPTVIHCFPSTLYILARILKKRNLIVRPRLIITHGELLLEHVRDEIKNIFKANILDQYGSNEFNRMAWQCKEYGNYHIDADNILIEFLDKDGNEVKPGTRGRVIVTHLFNRMMPLIRYDIGDYAIKSEGFCPCGRVLPLLERLEGRNDDFIILKGKGAISPRRLGGALEQVTSLEWYHLVQLDISTFVLHIIPNSAYNNDEKRFIERILKDILGNEVILKIKAVDTSFKTRTGKLQVIESKIAG